MEPVPLLSSLSDIYTSPYLAAAGTRWDALASAFSDAYDGKKAQFVARAPGRVNVIGEHVDTSNFSVLPAAIARDVLIAFTLSSASGSGAKTVVELKNMDGDKYTSTEFEVDLSGSGEDVTMPLEHHWSAYFIAGVKGLLNYISKLEEGSSALTPPPDRVQCLVTGSVPPGSGLSSSSAMTLASVIAFMQVLGRRESGLGKRNVTQIAIESERQVGVLSGGMDQAASCFSQPEHLLHIEFVPELTAKPIPLPKTNPPLSFVISNTLVTSNKAETGAIHYNLRVVEIRLGVLLLMHHLGLPLPSPSTSPLPTYRSISDTFFSSPPLAPVKSPSPKPPNALPPVTQTNEALPSSPLAGGIETKEYQLKTMLTHAAIALGGPGRERGITWAEAMEQLGLDPEGKEQEKYHEALLGGMEVKPENGRFKVWTRARHVLTESLRVYEFRDKLEDASHTSVSLNPNDTSSLRRPSVSSSSDIIAALGGLMNDSQTSCATDFECSCPELDSLIDIARKNGAAGSRLTGAGWGGSVISLVPEPQVPGLLDALRKEYYGPKWPEMTDDEFGDACFATRPESGACVFQL